MKRLLLIAPLLFASTAHAAGVVITNDGSGITAYRIAGKIRKTLVTIQSSRSAHAGLFEEAAQMHGVDARLLVAIAGRESAMNPNAVSPVGACGLMQLMPATARILGITNIFDPRENIFGAARYLRKLLDTYHGDLDLTLAAYNAGPGAVQRYNGIPPYPETQAYVKNVRARYERASYASPHFSLVRNTSK
jgi:soluble lytic murein transglycosylase-like protein